jgi:hypothetical protein
MVGSPIFDDTALICHLSPFKKPRVYVFFSFRLPLLEEMAVSLIRAVFGLGEKMGIYSSSYSPVGSIRDS